MSRVRRCDSRCHLARRPKCRCWCGGGFHGAAGASNRQALQEGLILTLHTPLLEKYGYKKGETAYYSKPRKLSEPALV